MPWKSDPSPGVARLPAAPGARPGDLRGRAGLPRFPGGAGSLPAGSRPELQPGTTARNAGAPGSTTSKWRTACGTWHTRAASGPPRPATCAPGPSSHGWTSSDAGGMLWVAPRASRNGRRFVTLPRPGANPPGLLRLWARRYRISSRDAPSARTMMPVSAQLGWLLVKNPRFLMTVHTSRPFSAHGWATSCVPWWRLRSHGD